MSDRNIFLHVIKWSDPVLSDQNIYFHVIKMGLPSFVRPEYRLWCMTHFCNFTTKYVILFTNYMVFSILTNFKDTQ